MCIKVAGNTGSIKWQSKKSKKEKWSILNGRCVTESVCVQYMCAIITMHCVLQVDKLCQLEHPNIVALFGSCFKKHYYYIVEGTCTCYKHACIQGVN